MLNLRSLSRLLNEKAHYVSQVINQDLGANFYELVNRTRIERAQRLLVEAPERTVLEIALSVGYNSKSTFNTAFRRQTGVTPTEYGPRRVGRGDATGLNYARTVRFEQPDVRTDQVERRRVARRVVYARHETVRPLPTAFRG